MSDLGRIREVFLELRDLEVSAQRARLDAIDDEALRAEVESLLAHHHRTHAGQIEAGVEAAVQHATVGWAASGDPERIGPFEIVERLGAGGMGIVYRARQAEPSRDVALKVLRHGALAAAHLARFRIETQVLGRLQHPGIAQIFEAGTIDDGGGARPYFVMELVEGVPLDAFAERRGLDTRARVELMVAVCDAVHHAHQKGVIHRDLKPANILVTDGGDPKVLDFGIARSTDADIRATTVQTEAGQLMGTLPYMSPEQVEGTIDGVDVRSDAYTLGVILHELLTGRLPYDVDRTSIPAAVRVIQETAPTRLGNVDTSLRGALETIAGAALEKSADRRYQSAAALGDDLQRWLDDLPIQARPPSLISQARLFARRHRVVVAAAMLVFVALVAATAISTVSAVRAAHDRTVAERVGLHMRNLLKVPDVHGMGADVTVLEMARSVLQSLDEASEIPEVEATVRQAIGETYSSLRRRDDAATQLRSAVALWRDVGDRDALASALVSLGVAQSLSGDFDGAVDAIREAIEISDAPFADPTSLTRYASLADALIGARRFEEAAPIMARVIDERRAGNSVELAVALRQQALVSQALGDVDAAIDQLNEALVLAQRTASTHPLVGATMQSLGTLHAERGEFEEAAPHFESAWHVMRSQRSADSPDWMSSAGAYLRCLKQLERHDDVIAHYVDVAERLEATVGADDFRVREAYGGLARYYDQLGRHDEAEAIRAARATSDIRAAPGGGHHP